MKLIFAAGFAGLLLAGCATAPEQHGMMSHDACMAKMHPKDATGAPHEMTTAEKAAMMKDCPMMKSDHDKAAAPAAGAADPHDHGAGETHKQ